MDGGESASGENAADSGATSGSALLRVEWEKR